MEVGRYKMDILFKRYEELLNRLTKSEDWLARNNYNDAVKDYNKSIKVFPKNIIAGMFGFEKKEYFEAKEEANNVPEVSFE